MQEIARHVIVSGMVQGVGFRHQTRVHAQQWGVSGWVRNLAGGQVEAHVEGAAAGIQALISWMHRGPAGARVVAVEITPSRTTHPVGFQVLERAHSES